MTAVLLAAAWVEFGPTLEFAVAAALLAALLAITVIDLRHQIIPDAITFPGILAGITANVRRATWAGQTSPSHCAGRRDLFRDHVASRGGMGAGDMKLGAMLGAFLGWKITLFGLMVGVVLGERGSGSDGLGVRGRKDAIPFGPFLAIGGATALFWGEGVVKW